MRGDLRPDQGPVDVPEVPWQTNPSTHNNAQPQRSSRTAICKPGGVNELRQRLRFIYEFGHAGQPSRSPPRPRPAPGGRNPARSRATAPPPHPNARQPHPNAASPHPNAASLQAKILGPKATRMATASGVIASSHRRRCKDFDGGRALANLFARCVRQGSYTSPCRTPIASVLAGGQRRLIASIGVLFVGLHLLGRIGQRVGAVLVGRTDVVAVSVDDIEAEFVPVLDEITA